MTRIEISPGSVYILTPPASEGINKRPVTAVNAFFVVQEAPSARPETTLGRHYPWEFVRVVGLVFTYIYRLGLCTQIVFPRWPARPPSCQTKSPRGGGVRERGPTVGFVGFRGRARCPARPERRRRAPAVVRNARTTAPLTRRGQPPSDAVFQYNNNADHMPTPPSTPAHRSRVKHTWETFGFKRNNVTDFNGPVADRGSVKPGFKSTIDSVNTSWFELGDLPVWKFFFFLALMVSVTLLKLYQNLLIPIFCFLTRKK